MTKADSRRLSRDQRQIRNAKRNGGDTTKATAQFNRDLDAAILHHGMRGAVR